MKLFATAAQRQNAQAVRSRETGTWRKRITPVRLAAAIMHPGVAASICFLAIVQVAAICVQLPGVSKRWDFSIYYLSAVAIREGLNPYTTDFRRLGAPLGLETDDIPHATDPPTFLMLIRPLAFMPERTAFYAWVGLNAVSLALALLLLSQSSALEPRVMLVLAALAVAYPPVYFHFIFAQSKILILLLLVVIIRMMDRGRDRAAGLFLALAGLVRIFPLLLIGYVAIQRRWRMLGWTLGGLALGITITLMAFGLHYSLSFVTGAQLLSQLHWLRNHWATNISVRGAVSRLVWLITGQKNGAGPDQVRSLVVFAADALLLGITVWATLRYPPGEDPDWRVLSMWIVASVLLSPTAWNHYMVLFFIPFGQLAIAGTHSRASARAEWMAIMSYIVVLPWELMLLPTPIIRANFGPKWGDWFWAAVFEQWTVSALLAYLATFWFTVDMQWRANQAEPSEADVPAFGKAAPAGH
jgi:hypothetical protein